MMNTCISRILSAVALLSIQCMAWAQLTSGQGNASPLVNRGSTTREDYRVQPQDVLNISVLLVPELTLDVTVNASGTINYAFFKDVPARDRTLQQIAEELEARLERDYIVDPKVFVSIKEYRERTVAVMGAVNKPGQVVMPNERDMDVLDAIVLAQDFSRTANKKKIQVIRNGQTFDFTLDSLTNVKDEKNRFLLMPGDIVRVGESFF